MIKITNGQVFNVDAALRGMRNPLDSWHMNDSYHDTATNAYKIGPNDLKLARNLRKAGSDHRKFLRQILVCVDFDAPLYW